jgi:hemolysin D
MTQFNSIPEEVPTAIAPQSQPQPKQKARPDRSFDSPVLLKRSPLWSRLIIWTIILCVGGAVSWAFLSNYEEAIPAAGQLEPQGAVKEVQSPVAGVVKSILVHEGQKVKKGDLLLQLDPKGQRSEVGSLRQVRQKLVEETTFYLQQMKLPTNQTYSLNAFAAAPQGMLSLADSRRALVAETQLFYAQLNGGSSSGALTAQQQLRLQVGLQEEASRASATRSEARQLEQQLQQTAIELASAQTTLASHQNLLEKITALADAGGIAKIEQVKQAEEAQKADAAVHRLQKEQERIRFAISQAQDKYQNTVSLSHKDVLDNIAANEKRLAEIDSQFAKAVVENQKQLAELDNRIAQAQFTMQYQEVRSPADGIIFDMKAKSPGFVTNVSEPILKLVPSDSLVAKVFVSNKDIGFIHPGMKVDVRVDSFPFSEYGDIKGKIAWVGSDALPPTEVRRFYSFPAKVILDSQSLKTQGKALSLQSGMSISVNIKTRSRNVMSIFTEQFTNQVEGVKHLR